MAALVGDYQDNLANLREQSLTAIALPSGMAGYVWLLGLVLRAASSSAVAGREWLGAALLTIAPTLAYALKGRRLPAASHALAWGILAGVACAVRSYPSPAAAYLLVLPVIFASVLLGQLGFVAVAVASVLFALRQGIPAQGSVALDPLLPAATIAAVTAASWLAARNLYTALDWTHRGYEQARQNEQVARRGQAELRRALKALDEATYRLERANYMLVIAHDQAEEARRLKQLFAQTISHELRTPLNLVVSFAELMLESPEHYGGPLPPSYLRDLSIVQRNARHLQGLVGDVLDLARIEAAQMSLLPEETDPAALVRETVATARSLLEARGLSLQTDVEPGLPSLWVDPRRIRQVLYNLLNNAARFTEQGSVTVRAHAAEGEVIFAVADTGVGIAAEDIPHIFEDFKQLDQGTRRRHEGAGLGLAISRRFVELHRGRIWVESHVGRGSTFHFALPTGRPSAEAAAGVIAPERAPGPPREGPVLLAVTRSPSAAGLLTRYLHGYRTVVARDLEQASQAARQLIPQAVVVDTAGEALDNGQLQALGQAWGLPNSPFIACPLPGEEPLRRRLDVDGYLIKPVSRPGLWDTLRQFGERIDSILVVDDDRDFLLLMARLLEDNPVRRYQVESAFSGGQALEVLQRRPIDLVLLDLGLPDMDGFALVERIRANPAWRTMPIVVVSGQEEMDNLQSLRGPLIIARREGLRPGEVVQWMQKVLDTAVRPRPGGDATAS